MTDSPSPQFVALSEKLLPCLCPKGSTLGSCPAKFRPAVALALEEQFNAGKMAERWMPIESAPHNKTTVALLMVRGNYRRYGTGWYMPLDGWQCWKFEIDGYSGGPTHWAPLPEPPKTAPDAKGEG